jgi:hypothetical protein
LAEIGIHPHAAEGTAAWRIKAIGRPFAIYMSGRSGNDPRRPAESQPRVRNPAACRMAS